MSHANALPAWESYEDTSVIPLENLPGFETTDLSALKLAYERQNPTAPHDQNLDDFRDFLTHSFQAQQLRTPSTDQGTLTGYFQPILKASRTQSAAFTVPVYKRPKELIVIENLGNFHKSLKGFRIAGTLTNQTLTPYFTRREIHQGALANRQLEIAYVQNPIDLFFMHIQGSGRLELEDGTILNLSYNGTNGYGYTAIGQEMVRQGFITPQEKTMAGVKAWLFENPDKAQDILCCNESYVFFQELPQTVGPVGAAHVILTPEATLAVDPDFIPLGSLVWIDTPHPLNPTLRLQRLMIAQDVGGAIKGPLRGDFYWGIGDDAGKAAGAMQGQSTFHVLVPQ